MSLAENSAIALLPRALGAILDRGASKGRRSAAKHLMKAMGPMRKRVMDALWDTIKDSATKDPYMSECVKAQLRSVIDSVAVDVDMQTQEALDISVGRDSSMRDLMEPEAAPRSFCGCRCLCRRCCGCYLRLRAFILSRILPCDKTLWGTIREPVWWFVSVPTLVTLYNIRCTVFFLILILLLLPGPPDEYQLTTFVVHFKVNQFFVAGIGHTLRASFVYYWCILFNRSNLLACVDDVTHPPLSFWYTILDYAGSFLLPQVAMFMFYFCQRLVPRHQNVPSDPNSKAEIVRSRQDTGCCGWPAPVRLRMLHKIDTLCFVLSLTSMIVLTAAAKSKDGRTSLVCERWFDTHCERDPTLMFTAFWSQVLYGLTCVPFLLFAMPDFTALTFSLVSQARRTGYDQEGRCVLFHMQAAPRARADDKSESSREELSGSDSESSSANDKEHRGFLGFDWRVC